MTARSLLLGERNPLRRRRPSASVGPRGSVTYPTTRLVTRVQIALGADLSADPLTWNWLDITAWVRYDLGISLTTGRRDEATQVTTGSAVLKLDNRDGRFTRRNPNSPYYGLLSKNTPIWVTVDAGSGEKTRVEMFVNEWPNRWSDKSANDTTVTIRCAGILRRLQQGRPLKSALRRAIAATSPVAYWPMEDGTSATEVASALAGGASMVPSGSVTLSADATLAGAGSLPTFDNDETGVFRGGSIPTFTSTFWGISMWAQFHTQVAADTFMRIADITVSGSTENYWEISAYGTISSNPGFQVSSRDGSGFFLDAVSGFPTPDPYDGDWHNVQVWVSQNGSNIDASLYVDGVLEVTASIAGTVGQPTVIFHNPRSTGTAAAIDCSIGHVSVHSSSTGLTGFYDAGIAHAGEMAHVRMARLCREEGVSFETLASESTAMGAQSSDTLLNLLQECAEADLGALYEKRWGLAYKSLNEFYNQPVSLALDFDQGHIAGLPEPADDDQRTRNLWTVSRLDGSEGTAEEMFGPMGTGAQGPGVYDDSTTVNVETDNQLSSQAGWRVHLGTIDEDRWPSIPLNFTRTPSLIDTWTALPFGARITVSHPPSQMAPDALDLVIEGYGERWDPIIWGASLNCSPASAYRVNVVGSTDGNLGRVDAANSTLAVDATSSATSLSVASPAALWRTGAVNFDIGVAGERMTVTNISGGSSPQTFTVTRSVNGVVKAQPATVGGIAVKVSLWKPGVYAL